MALRIKVGDSKLTTPHLDGGGVPIYHYDGKPFTGFVFDNHDNGNLAWEEEYENGFQEGWWHSFYPSGKKKKEYKSHNNIEIDGTFKKWDENGKLILSY